MTILKRVIQILIAILIIASVLGIIFITYLYYDTKPILDGIIPAEEISNSTEIIRDKNGFVHIYANNDLDAYYSLGYAIAQDRLWQMAFLRMTASGKLSQHLGEKYLHIDERIITIQIYEKSMEIAEILLNRNGDDHYMKCMLMYLQGINSYIEQIGKDLPIEFRLLSFTPEPFKLHDLYAVSTLYRYIMTYDKSMIGSLINDYGFDNVTEFALAVDLDKQAIATHKSVINAFKTEKNPYLSFNKELYKFFNTQFSDFTGNVIAVSGSKSKLHMPILTNGLSLPTTTPQVLYEAHIVTPQQNFTGYFLPLSPFGLMGHNDQISWGVTNSMLDDTDYYIETINPENPNQYLYKNEWVDMELIKTNIKISGKANGMEIIIKKTRNGVVINEFIIEDDFEEDSTPQHKALVFKWSLYDLPYSLIHNEDGDLQTGLIKEDWFRTFYVLNHAENYKQFQEGLGFYNGVGLELIYADIYGFVIKNIIGKVPKRKEYATPLFYMDNSYGDYDWDGYHSKKVFYYHISKENGYLISANSPIEDNSAYVTGNDGERFYYSYFFYTSSRFYRLEQLLKQSSRIGIDDVKALYSDNKDAFAEYLMPTIREELRKYPHTKYSKKEQKLFDLLNWWYYETDKEEIPPLIFNELYRQLIIYTFKDDLITQKELDFILSDELIYTNFSRLIMENPESNWFDNKTTEETETLKEALRHSLRNTYYSLKKNYGSNIDSWEWGDSHRLSYRHILGSRFPDKIFNTDVYPVSGSFGSINKSFYEDGNPFTISNNVSLRMIASTNNFKYSLFAFAPGNSGHFHSNNYKDQVSMLINYEYKDPTNTREWTYKEMVDRIKLVPKND